MPVLSHGLPDAEWDRELFQRGGHFMQGGAWMAVQQALGDGVVHTRGEGWRFAAVVHRGRGLRWLYTPYGPSIWDPGRLGEAVRAVAAAGRELGADFVRVEPDLVVGSSAVVGTREGEAGASDPPRAPGAPAGSAALPGTALPGTALPGTALPGTALPGAAIPGEAAAAEAALRGLGAVSARGVQPRHTLVLDLRRSEEDLRSDLLSGRRRSINAATRKGIAIRRSRDVTDVEEFVRLIRKTGRRGGFDPHAAAYYRTACAVLFERGAASLYLADVEGRSVAAVIAFESPTTGYYAHAADDPERSRQIVAAAPLAWRIVLDCRAEGRTAFDFWGVIPEDDPHHPWAGFSRFKKTFGGRLVTRPGTWDVPLRTLRYRAYRAAREARGRVPRR